MSSENVTQAAASTTAATPTPVDPYASYYQGKLQVSSNACRPYATVYYTHELVHQPPLIQYNYENGGVAPPEPDYPPYQDPYRSNFDNAYQNEHNNSVGVDETPRYRNGGDGNALNGANGYHHTHENYHDEGFREERRDDAYRYHRDNNGYDEPHYQQRNACDFDEGYRYEENNSSRNYHNRSSHEGEQYRNDNHYSEQHSFDQNERFHGSTAHESRRERENSEYDDYRDRRFQQRPGDNQAFRRGEDERLDSRTERPKPRRDMTQFKYEDDYSSLPVSFGSKRKARQNKKPTKKPRSMGKYHRRKYNLFHRFDEGIRMDEVSWYSVTPETIARHHARRFRAGLPPSSVVLDAFLGGAGNAIQFALEKFSVLGIELCEKRLDIAKHNAGVYGVANDIEFILGNAFHLIPVLKNVDAVLLSPPWGGPEYLQAETFDVKQFVDLVEKARALTPNIAILLPKNIDFQQAVELFGECEVEQNWDEDGRMRMVTIYFGNLVRSITVKETGPTWIDLSIEEEDEYGTSGGDGSGTGDAISPVSVQQHSTGYVKPATNVKSQEALENGNKDEAKKDPPSTDAIADSATENDGIKKPLESNAKDGDNVTEDQSKCTDVDSVSRGKEGSEQSDNENN